MRSFYVSFGIWIALIPYLGIPGTWKNILIAVSGLLIVAIAVGPIFLKKIQVKPKTKRKPAQNKIPENTEINQSQSQ